MRTILHADLNNFYASVACHDNPELRSHPVAVAGNQEERHGIILAKNMAAKKCGVTTGEPIVKAKQKCPGLITVLPDFKRYAEVSKKAREIYMRYSDMVEPFGPDEAWIDVTGSRIIFGTGREIAERIRLDIRRELGLTVSIGVSFNKVFAKIGSDLKKPDAITEITPENFKTVVWNLPCDAMIGIGPATYRKLNNIGIFTLGELSRSDEKILTKLLGKNGSYLLLAARGQDVSRVAPDDYVHIPQSVGRSTTTSYDLKTYSDVWRVLLYLSEEVAQELRKYKLDATGIALHLRTSELKVSEIQMPLLKPTMLGMELCKNGMELFKNNYDFDMPLRSLGIRAINLQSAESGARQTYLFYDTESEMRLETIENKMDELRNRFGKESIKRCVTLYEKKGASAEKPFSPIFR